MNGNITACHFARFSAGPARRCPCKSPSRPTSDKNVSQSQAFSLGQAVESSVNGLASRGRIRIQFSKGNQQKAALQLAGQAADIQNQRAVFLMKPFISEVFGDHRQRLCRFCQRRGSSGNAQRIERMRRRSEPLAHGNTVIGAVLVAGVSSGGDAGRCTDGFQFGLGELQKRPNNSAIPAAYRGKPIDAASPRKPHQNGFELVVGMVCSGDPAKVLRVGPIAQQSIARVTRRRLDISRYGRGRFEDCARSTQLPTQVGNKCCFCCRFCPQSVIDRRDCDTVWKCGLGEE